MTLELRKYAATKIGQTWTLDDHKFLLAALVRTNQTCIDVWNQCASRRGPRCEEPDVLNLPFGEVTGDPEL